MLICEAPLTAEFVASTEVVVSLSPKVSPPPPQTTAIAMADNAPKDSSPKNDSALVGSKEDAETRAARRELKQSTISDHGPNVTASTTEDQTARPTTPPADVSEPKDQILSPKKKRAHEQLDEDKGGDNNDAKSTTSTDSAKDRASRLEPEKKRHRDGDSTENFTVGVLLFWLVSIPTFLVSNVNL